MVGAVGADDFIWEFEGCGSVEEDMVLWVVRDRDCEAEGKAFPSDGSTEHPVFWVNACDWSDKLGVHLRVRGYLLE